MDKNKIAFIIAHKYIKGYISYTEYYINNINKFYENALIVVVDNNSISKDDIFDNLKKYENVVLYEGYDYITMTQDNFIIKNKFDFNELHKRNVTACPLVGCEIDTNKTFRGVQFDHMDYYVPFLETIGVTGRLHEMTFCWCTSFIIKSTKINDLLHYLNQIVIKERWQSCAGERYMGRILLELNDGENYSIDGNLSDIPSKYSCHGVDLFSDLSVFFAKRVQGKNTGPIC